MQKQTVGAKHRAQRNRAFLEAGFTLFSANGIESVKMADVAAASGHGIATMYRYFDKKASFAVAIAEWKWGEFFKANRKRRPSENFEGKTAADMFDFYLDSYLEVYRNHRDLLRFNQFFNVYLRSEEIDEDHKERYMNLMKPIAVFVHTMYERGKKDGTLRTDISEAEMFSVTMHLMLAVVTRYAIGLVYEPEEGFDPEQELETQKRMLYREFTTQ